MNQSFATIFGIIDKMQDSALDVYIADKKQSVDRLVSIVESSGSALDHQHRVLLQDQIDRDNLLIKYATATLKNKRHTER